MLSEEEKAKRFTFFEGEIQGRAGADSETKFLRGTTELMQVSIAVNKGKEEARRTVWVKLKAWNDVGRGLHIPKGAIVRATGAVDLTEWVGRDGSKRQSLEMTVDHMRIVDRPEAARRGGGGAPKDFESFGSSFGDAFSHTGQEMTEDDIPF